MQEHQKVTDEVEKLQSYKQSLELMNTASHHQEQGNVFKAYTLFVQALNKIQYQWLIFHS